LTPQRLWCRPKISNPTNHFPADMTAHNAHFEPTVEIHSSRTKGHDLAQLNIKYPSSTPYK